MLTEESYTGTLFINEKQECYTLENTPKSGKLIPEGTYDLINTYSPKFKRMLPLVNNVPGFKGIRIHAGNTKKDTYGCILVGNVRGKDIIYNSQVTLKKLIEKLNEAWKNNEKITIELKNA